jgi:HAD superfamily hydrolase (TIGR01549 family)
MVDPNPPSRGPQSKAVATMAMIRGDLGAHVWLFDFDNTLAALEKRVDWVEGRRELEGFLRSEGIDEAILREFPSRNLPLYNALLTRTIGSKDRSSEVATSGRKDSVALIRDASRIIEAYELRGVDSAEPLPGAGDLLQKLRERGNRLAIVTSNSSRTVTRWLAQQSLTSTVDVVVGRDSLLPLKPAPEMLLRALYLCDGTATDTVLVGDSEADLRAASTAGIRFLGIAATAEARMRLEALGVRDIFRSPSELANSSHFPGVSTKV